MVNKVDYEWLLNSAGTQMKLIKKPSLASLKKWKIFEHIPDDELKQIHSKIE